MDPKNPVDRIKAEVAKDFNKAIDDGLIPYGVKLPIPGEETEAVTPPAAPEATPALEAKQEPEAEGKEPLIFGKYKTLEEAEKGYYNVLNYASTQADKAKQLEAALGGNGSTPNPSGSVPLVPGSSPGASPRVNPAARSHVDWIRDDAVTKLAENSGIEPTYLADFAERLYQRAEEAAALKAQEQLAPLQAQAEAEAYMRSKHPEAYNFLPEIGAFVQNADKDVQDTLGALMSIGKHKQAMEYAWTQFRAAVAAGAQTNMKANSEVAEAGKKAAKAAASLPASSPGTPIHAANPDEPDPKMMAELAEKAKAGDYMAQQAYRDLKVTRILKQDPQFAKILEKHNREYGLR